MEYGTSVELIDWNEHGDETIIRAARTCYNSGDKSTPESDDKLIERLIKSGHHAMLEFGWAAFRIKCSRVVSHELVRHRVGISFAQRSQRFVSERAPDFQVPPELFAYPDSVCNLYFSTMHSAWSAYQELLSAGVPKQIARYALPNACMTELVVAANYREWRHVCKLRCSPKCQPEMQEVAGKILAILKQIAPGVFSDVGEPS